VLEQSSETTWPGGVSRTDAVAIAQNQSEVSLVASDISHMSETWEVPIPEITFKTSVLI
jgi:hypothetical protein